MEVAIQKDCETLIERFVSNNNPKFASFVQQWKSASFHRIFTGQSLSTEIIQSTNTCLHYAKRVLTHKSTLSKLGALYLLYAIYFKQPTEQFQKIDIDLDSWKQLNEFLTGLDQGYGDDARCIFWELVKGGAFRFVATDTYHGLENFLNLDKIGNSAFNLSKTLSVFDTEVNQLTCGQGILSGVEKLEEGYNEMKELMNQSSAGDKTAAMLPTTSNLGELKTAFGSLQAFIKKNCSQRTRRDKKTNQKKDRVKNKVITNSNFRTGGRVVLR